MTVETRTRVNEKGRIAIPADFRRILGINIGDEVVLWIEDGELRITTFAQRLVAQAQHLVRKHVKRGVSLADELIAERRRHRGCP